jgi:hypothetical protein
MAAWGFKSGKLLKYRYGVLILGSLFPRDPDPEMDRCQNINSDPDPDPHQNDRY